MTEMTDSSESDPSARKRQRTEADGAASGFSQQEERQSSGDLPGQAADRGQAKVAEVTGSRRPKAAEKQTAKKMNNPQPRPSKTPTENKDWCNLSKSAQSRHMRNDVRARIRSMIPGHTKISENSLMLQVAEKIRQLKREIDSAAIHLERLQSSNGTAGAELENNFKDQNVPSASASKKSSPMPAGQNGHDVLRSVLPQPSKAKGSRLLQIALEYMTELTAESDKLKQGDERQVYIQDPMMDTNSTPNHKSHLITSVSAELGGCVGVPSIDATSVPNGQFTDLAAESAEESTPEGPGKL